MVWNIEEGKKLDGSRIGRAERKRTELYDRIRTFMQNYEFLVLPVSQVPPFDVKQRYDTETNGETMETYIDWMKSCYYVTVTGLPPPRCPAASHPRVCPWASRPRAATGTTLAGPAGPRLEEAPASGHTTRRCPGTPGFKLVLTSDGRGTRR